jgi:hypothetical protein
MWKWKTLCQATAPQEFRRLIPSHPSRSVNLAASRCAATAVRCRSWSGISSRSREWSRGTTRECPRVHGLMSRNATVCSSSSRRADGSSPETTLQKMQSSLTGRLAYRPS